MKGITSLLLGKRPLFAVAAFAGAVSTLAVFGQARKPEVPQFGKPWVVGITTAKEGWVKAPNDPNANAQGFVFKKTEDVVCQLRMVPIPAGTFMMGSPDNEAQRGDNEALHEVTLTKSFWLGVTEVTQEQWEALMGNNPCEFKGKDLPVERIRWPEVLEFCKRLTEQERAAGRLPEGYIYTLPTEAQWEYACRAGSKRMSVFSFGDRLTSRQANFDGTRPYGTEQKGTHLRKTAKVGSYPPNAWGLYDMHGNVFEWCIDRYGEYSKGKVTDPVGVFDARPVRRGGCWRSDGKTCRSALRQPDNPNFNSEDNGFRVALAFVGDTDSPQAVTRGDTSPRAATGGNASPDKGEQSAEEGIFGKRV